MMDFLARLFGRIEGGSQNSRDSAKDRLRLVLVHDRSTLSPGLMEQLKCDLIEVIERYMDIDETNMKVEFDNQDASVAIIASIPVKEVKRDATAQAK